MSSRPAERTRVLWRAMVAVTVLLFMLVGTFAVIGEVQRIDVGAADVAGDLSSTQTPRFGGTMIGGSGNFSVEQAKTFSDYPLYSLENRYRDLPLVAVLRANGERRPLEPVRQDNVSFVYGRCESIDGHSCAPPLTIQVWNACERNRSVYDPSVIVPDEDTQIRGVPAAFFEGHSRLELYTGRATIVIFSWVPAPDLLRDAAERLTPVNALASPSPKLPAPPVGMMQGRAAVCR
jgi:hypothetical protein